MTKRQKVFAGVAAVAVVVIVWLLLQKRPGDTTIINKRGGYTFGDIDMGDFFYSPSYGDFSIGGINLYLRYIMPGPVQFNIGGLTFGGSNSACSSCTQENTRRLFPWLEDTLNGIVNFYRESNNATRTPSVVPGLRI